MNFRKLKIFYETAISLNMSKVAKEMFISQPSISQSINELEGELGVKLFDRIGKRLYLTHDGEVFLNYTRRMLNLYDEATEALRASCDSGVGKIVIGASTTIGIYVLPQIIKEFSKKYKEIEISIIIENTKHIERLILENKVDFAFVEGEVISDEVIVNPFWEDELVVICGEEHRWKGLKAITAKDFAEEKIIMREVGSGTRKIIEAELLKKNIEYKTFLELGNTEAIKNVVEANLGVSVMSIMCVNDKAMKNELEILRFEDGSINRDLSLIIHRDKFISKNMERFIEFSKEYSIDK